MALAGDEGGEARVLRQLRASDDLREAAPRCVVLDRHGEPAILAGRLEHPVRSHVRIAVAVACGRLAVHRVLDDRFGEDGHRRLPLREIDVLAAAGARAMQQGGEDGNRAMQAAGGIAVRDADVHRWMAAVR